MTLAEVTLSGFPFRRRINSSGNWIVRSADSYLYILLHDYDPSTETNAAALESPVVIGPEDALATDWETHEPKTSISESQLRASLVAHANQNLTIKDLARSMFSHLGTI